MQRHALFLLILASNICGLRAITLKRSNTTEINHGSVSESRFAPIVDNVYKQVAKFTELGTKQSGIIGWGYRYGFASRYSAAVGPIPPFIQSGENADDIKCSQVARSGAVEGVEDCHYLGVYAPDSAIVGSPLPVVIILHYGGFVTGSKFTATEVQYVVKAGIIVVSMNYRLGALGFFAHPALEEPNLGIADQIVAMEWVQNYVALFGGNPFDVTIAGGSAGGRSVMLHHKIPHSHTLYHKAVSDSGGFFLGFWSSVSEIYGKNIKPCLEKLPFSDGGGASASLSLLKSMEADTLLDFFSANCSFLVKMGQPSLKSEKWAYSKPGGVVPNMKEALCNRQVMNDVPYVSADSIDSMGIFGFDGKKAVLDIVPGLLSMEKYNETCIAGNLLSLYSSLQSEAHDSYKHQDTSTIALNDANYRWGQDASATGKLAPTWRHIDISKGGSEGEGGAQHLTFTVLMMNLTHEKDSMMAGFANMYGLNKDPPCRAEQTFELFTTFVKTGYWGPLTPEGSCDNWKEAFPSQPVTPGISTPSGPAPLGGVPIYVEGLGYSQNHLFSTRTMNIWDDIICTGSVPPESELTKGC